MTFPVAEPSAALQFAAKMLRSFLVLSVLFWSLSFFHRFHNRSTPLWRELSSNSFNIYLIHMELLVVLQALTLSWPVPAALKFACVSLVTLSLSYLVSRFVVRKSAVVTVLGLVLLFVALCLFYH